MPLPANVARIKVHPAIGVARVSTGDGFYIYGDQPTTYHQDGRMRRQAVQFRLFAYADGNVGIEELTPQHLDELAIEVVWHAHVANRKIQRQRDASFLLEAQARSDVNNGKLIVPTEPVNATARELDRDALERCTTDFAPGIEMFPFFFPSLNDVFLSASEVGDANELRVARRLTPLGPGVEAGEFTSGLCSPWQNDFLACTCFFWAAQHPDSAFADETSPT